MRRDKGVFNKDLVTMSGHLFTMDAFTCKLWNIDESADTTMDTPSPGSSTPLQSKLTKPPKRRRYNPVAQEALSIMKNLGDKIKPRDEFDAFGEYDAGQLRKCTDLRQQMVVTKHRINQALFYLEIANLPSNQPTPKISTPSRMSYETDESVSLLDNFLSDDTDLHFD
ncbi:hypothetical protein J6590_077126 [Homalodisca vitripennis]|nr:hypothetical protein J6590_077126 [Homalodisca vitripennis]